MIDGIDGAGLVVDGAESVVGWAGGAGWVVEWAERAGWAGWVRVVIRGNRELGLLGHMGRGAVMTTMVCLFGWG